MGLVWEHSYFGQKIRCRKEDLSPVPEKVSERWGCGGRDGNEVEENSR